MVTYSFSGSRGPKTAKSASFLTAGVLLAVVSSLLPQTAFSQKSPAPTPGITHIPTQPTVPPPPPSEQKLVVVSGKIEMTDGTAMPAGVVVERVCRGAVQQRVQTDSAGTFIFQIGQMMGLPLDVSAPGSPRLGAVSASTMSNPGSGLGLDKRQLAECELRASASGLRSSNIDLGRFQIENPLNVGTIFLSRGERIEGVTLNAVLAQAPKDARKAYEKGIEAENKGDLAAAERELQKAVKLYPQHAAAWFELGGVFQQQNQADAARRAYLQALSADPRFVPPYFSLAMIASHEGKWEEVIGYTEHGLELDPLDYPIGYFYDAVANYNLRNLDAAYKSARNAERLDQRHQIPRVHFLLGGILADQKQYRAAVDEWKTYLSLVPDGSDRKAVEALIAKVQEMSRASAVSSQP